MKDRFPKIFKRKEFYIVSLICIFALVITTTVAIKRNISKQKEDNLSEGEDFIIVPEEEPVLETTQMEEVEDEADKKEEDKEEDLEFVEEEKPQPEEQEVQTIPDVGIMMPPVKGKLGVDFAKDELIYSETLEEWTNHNGIDIFAQEGQEVKAALSGQINEVYEDQLWGKVIIIDHGNGLMTKYANLSTTDMVKEGTRVEKGAIISKIGNTAAIEMIMEPHIHFEVIKDGEYVDPKEYIPAFSH